MHLKPNIETDTIVDTLSWIAKNPDYHYQLLGGPGAEEFVMKHFPQHLDLYKSIPNTGSKSDLLRYMLLAVEGGIYTDLDTVALQPVDSWIPPHYKDQARVIIGLEYDQRDDDFVFAELHPTIQFCQWTIAAAPGHKIFDNMVQQAVDSLKKFEQEYDLPISNITLKNPEVLSSTGPGAWTDVVFEGLKIADPSITTLKNISRLSEPRLYGDILLLPIDAFGMGQVHSGSTRGDDIPKNALAKHNFRGHWRTKEES
jgi:alpha 1,6-mannosyltransferase